MNLNEMKRKAKKLYSFRGLKSRRTPRAKSALFENPLCRPPRGLFLRSLSPFFHPLPLVQKGNSTRPPADKRNPIPCFICLYRRSYPLDRRIIGKTDNNETRDITVNELQLLIADHFCKLEFTLCAQKRYIYHHEKLKLSLFGFKIFILFRVLKYRQLNFIPINIFSIILRNRG